MVAYNKELKGNSVKDYNAEDLKAVNSPALTDDEIASLRPAQEVLPPAFFKGIEEVRKSRGRPRIAAPKVAVTLRLDPDLVDAFKKFGANWRTVMAQTLRKAV